MSYSFSVTAKSKAGAKAKVRVEMAKVVQNQTSHAADATQALAAADALIDVVGEPQNLETLNATIAGSLGWADVADEDGVVKPTSANLQIAVYRQRSSI